MPYRSYSRDQDWLLPPSLGELVPEDHPVRFVAEFVDLLDLGVMGMQAQAAVEGAPAFHPKVLLASWVYGFMVRVRSSRQIERACRESIPFLWLTGLQRPDHVTLWRFYAANRAAIRGLLQQTVQVAIEVGLVDFVLQAVDGSKVAVGSSASLQDEAGLRQLLAQVEQEIATLEQAQQRAEAAAVEPAPSTPRWLGQQVRRARLQQALASVAQRTAEASPRAKRRQQAAHKRALQRKAARRGVVKQGPLVSTTDPEARHLQGRHGYVVGYNSQLVVDSRTQIVVAADVVDCANDVEQLRPMLAEAAAMTGRPAERVVADSGYFAMNDLMAASAQGVEVFVPDGREQRRDGPANNPFHKAHFSYDAVADHYICPLGQVLTYKYLTQWNGKAARVYRGGACTGCPAQASGACTKAKQRSLAVFGHEQALQTHAAKMQTPLARQLLQQRKVIIEPVFGMLREQQGLLRFLVRGRAKVTAEWRLLCVAHNLRKLWKHWWRPKLAAAATAT